MGAVSLFMTKGFGVAKKPVKKKAGGSDKAAAAKRASTFTGFPFTGPLRPGVQSPRRPVSSNGSFFFLIEDPLYSRIATYNYYIYYSFTVDEI